MRTTTAAVQAILGRNWATAVDVTPYMEIASEVVNGVAACAEGTLSSAKLELMERWLSAHYYLQMDPLYKSRSELSQSGSFSDQSYKEPALALDTTGCLAAALAGGKVGTVEWAGKPDAEELSYEERNP